jgi:hypothetical protein
MTGCYVFGYVLRILVVYYKYLVRLMLRGAWERVGFVGVTRVAAAARLIPFSRLLRSARSGAFVARRTLGPRVIQPQ